MDASVRYEKFRQMIDKVDLRHFAFPIKLSVGYGSSEHDIVIRASSWVQDRDTGRAIEVCREMELRPLGPAGDVDEQAMLYFVRRVIKELVEHEVDEAFHYDGKRVWDPHAKRRIA